MSFHHPMRAHSFGQHLPPLAEKITEEPITNKTAQNTVTWVYQTHISSYWRNVTTLWCKNLMNHSLQIMVQSTEGELRYNCKIEVKPWHFWSKKGYKSFEVEGSQVDVYWDLRSAKFSGSPEPYGDFYVALVSNIEVVLLLGDYKKKAYKRTKARPALVEPALFYKKENVFAEKSFSTRAKFDERRKEHDIVVASSTTGPRDPEMWVSIDAIMLIHVRNLQWKFRGNQTVLVDKQPVQVLWDVHDWLFSGLDLEQGMACSFLSQEQLNQKVTGRAVAKDVIVILAMGAGITQRVALEHLNSACSFTHGRLSETHCMLLAMAREGTKLQACAWLALSCLHDCKCGCNPFYCCRLCSLYLKIMCIILHLCSFTG